MSDVTTLVEEPIAAPEPGSFAKEERNGSGIVLPPFDPDRAIAALEWLRQQVPDEQRETLEYLKRALN
jgi:hypothetical protein